jgi:RHS repeat-associated protein
LSFWRHSRFSAVGSLGVLFLCLLACGVAAAQNLAVATGAPAFNSFGGGPFDQLNLGNLNVHLQIPIFHRPGRGTDFDYTLSYDSSLWTPVGASGSQTWYPSGFWGWVGAGDGVLMYGSAAVTGFCPMPPNMYPAPVITITGVLYVDSRGNGHYFPYYYVYNTCTQSTYQSSYPLAATDGSGYNLAAADAVQSPGGAMFYPASNGGSGSGMPGLTDNNGNQITSAENGSNLVYTDTLGTTALTIGGSGTPSSPNTLQYPVPSGGSAQYTMNYGSYNIKSNFGCSGIGEYSANGVVLLSSIGLPDGSQYTFSYEPTPGYSGYYTGRIAQVTLPKGGTIGYAYSGGHNGIECSDGSTAGLTRTVTPGGGLSAGTWTYSRSNSSGNFWTTTVTDPQSNNTTIAFSKDSNATAVTNSFYETSRTNSALTTWKCWNNNPSSCPSAATAAAQTVSAPITQRDSYRQPAGGNIARTLTTYNAYELPTDVKQYDYGSNPSSLPLLRDTQTTYASLSGIVNLPHTVSVYDGNGNLISQTTNGYDEVSPTGTSGFSQHTSPPNGSRGNLTSTTTVANGSTTLYRYYRYYDTGVLSSSSAPNTSPSMGPTTTYTYGSGSCNGAFPTTSAGPTGLSSSATWNCSGGVQLTGTDPNGATSTTNYTDAYFWRPSSSVDAANNTTSYSYPSPNQSETVMSWGTASTADVLTTVDGFGRKRLVQRRQAPGSSQFDSVQTDYDANGRAYRTSMPFQATAGALGASVWASTTTSFDVLNRPLAVTDGGGGTTGYTYSQNDKLVSRTPAPSGENPKRRQLQYDALRRLSSVCEVTGASGSGNCAQSSAQTGYWTTYGYALAGGNNYQTTQQVTQNAQGSPQQARTYNYDALGRLTLESNPESGAVHYYYDGPTTHCSNTSPGDLIETDDAAGNITCYYYDSLHRLTDAGYSGPVCRRFRYGDQSLNVPSGITISNGKGRQVEAYTDNCAGVQLTDEWFSYSARGEVIGVWQETPNSGGYYYVSAAYWANGTLASLGGSLGLPALAYGGSSGSGLDGEGRVAQVTASSGQSPLIGSVSYNVAGQPLGGTFGSGDSDGYGYDPNTGRQTSFQANVGGTNPLLSGTLTWNANGSLGTLALNYNGQGENCTYSHDDLSRIASVNCNSGSTWAQTFGYDAFGNVTKSGTGSWLPTYNQSTNRIQSIPGASVSYDANGNLLSDGAHNYTWDGNWGNPSAIDTVSLTYDALGRMVEQNRGGTYTQVVYSPSGAKLAQMNGQSLQKAFVPLPGGGRAVYNSGGLAYYRHPDWLGSSRLATTPSQTVYAYTGYAPFGESYEGQGSTDLSFTGQNQDTVSGLDDFLYREYSPAQGRWTRPDPSGMKAVDTTNPQSWNRYAYVANKPLASIDRHGLASNPLTAPATLMNIWCSLFGFDCSPMSPDLGPFGSGGGGASTSWGPDPGTTAPPAPSPVHLPNYGGSATVTAAAAAVPYEEATIDGTIPYIDTPYGPAFQAAGEQAADALSAALGGQTLYRSGITGIQETVGAQFWSLDNPLLFPNYNEMMGMPPAVQGAEGYDFVMTGQLLPGASAITRFAPAVEGGGVGGAIEVVIDTTEEAIEYTGFFVP